MSFIGTAPQFAHCMPPAGRMSDAMLAGYELHTYPAQSRYDRLPVPPNSQSSQFSVAPSTKALPPKLVIESRRMTPCRVGLVEFARNNLQEPQRGSGAQKISVTLRYFSGIIDFGDKAALIEEWNFCDVILEPSTSYDKLFKFLQRKALNALKKSLKEKLDSEPSDISGSLKLVYPDKENIITTSSWHSYIRNDIRFGNCGGELKFDFTLGSERPTSITTRLNTAANAAGSAIARLLSRECVPNKMEESKSQDFEERYTKFRTGRQIDLICRRRAREHLVV